MPGFLLGASFGFGYSSCISHVANNNSTTSDRAEGAVKDVVKDVAPADEQDPHRSTWHRMVSEQIQRRGVRNEVVLAAMRKVPRHRAGPARQSSRPGSRLPGRAGS